jgi:hypothetical protein
MGIYVAIEIRSVAEPNGTLVFVRADVYRGRLRTDSSQWLGIDSDRRL